MLHDALFALWFLLPAAAANVAPIFSAVFPYIKTWNAPIDGGHVFRGKRILGPHKTWRGIVTGFGCALLIVFLEHLIVQQTEWGRALVHGTDYLELPVLGLAVLFTLGALGGDAVKSFFKRQLNIRSGKSWFPFDQIDYIVGTCIIMAPFIVLSPAQYVWVFAIWTTVHLCASYLGWAVGLKKDPI